MRRAPLRRPARIGSVLLMACCPCRSRPSGRVPMAQRRAVNRIAPPMTAGESVLVVPSARPVEMVNLGESPRRRAMDDLNQQSGRFRILDPKTAKERLEEKSDDEIAKILTEMHVGYAVEILEEFDEERRERIAAATPFGHGQLWLKGHSYPEGTVGRLMERPPAVFRPNDTIGTVTAALREIVKKRMVVYIFVTEADGHLVGVVAFRELLFSRPEQKLEEIMLKNPFSLRADMELVDAMREVVT